MFSLPQQLEEGPWLADTSSVLQPKALLPTPRYCQPPPTYRPRPPLFPVPPPGSCLLPPPPLPTLDGLISPHSWQQDDFTQSKGDRWRKMSWTAGEGGSLSSPPPTFYNYHKQAQARPPRTLVEVPLQPQATSVIRSDPQPIQAPKQAVSVLQSNLDPTSRPFTPAGFQCLPPSLPRSFPPNSYDDNASVTSDKINDGVEAFSYFEKNPSTQPSEGFSEKSFATTSSRHQESFSSSQHGSFFADDPLSDNPKFHLPDLDNSNEDQRVLMHMEGKLPIKKQPIQFPIDFSSNILPPPILPFASHWSGKSRPPLLPTPKNFPPYGPRPVPPIYEEDFSSTYLPTITSLPPAFPPTPSIPFPAPQYTYKPKEHVGNQMLPGRKPGFISRLSDQNLAVSKLSRQRLPFSSNFASEVSSSINNIRDLPNDDQGWDPSFPPAEPGSLLDTHPVPDEYLVAKVIGAKLPPIKLPNCHTDLLLFLFYAWQEDATQLVAASLLFERGWRFHTEDKVWLARWPGVQPEKKTTDWEEGLYQYFDVKVWRRIPGWFRLNYVQLAEKTGLIEQEASLLASYSKPVLTA